MNKFFTRPDGSEIEDIHERGYLMWKEMFVGPGWYSSDGDEWYLDIKAKPIASGNKEEGYGFSSSKFSIRYDKKFNKEEIERIIKLQAFQ